MPEEMLVNKIITGAIPEPNLTWWLTYLENFRLRLKSELNRFTLDNIGKCGHLRDGEYGSHKLSEDNPVLVGNNKFSLSTQGIFDAEILSPTQQQLPKKEGVSVKMFWGLTRNAEWVKVEYYFLTKGRKEVATMVNIRETDLEKLFKMEFHLTEVTPIKVWTLLYYQVKEWHRKREELFRHSKSLFDEVCLVSQLFKVNC